MCKLTLEARIDASICLVTRRVARLIDAAERRLGIEDRHIES